MLLDHGFGIHHGILDSFVMLMNSGLRQGVLMIVGMLILPIGIFINWIRRDLARLV